MNGYGWAAIAAGYLLLAYAAITSIHRMLMRDRLERRRRWARAVVARHEMHGTGPNDPGRRVRR